MRCSLFLTSAFWMIHRWVSYKFSKLERIFGVNLKDRSKHEQLCSDITCSQEAWGKLLQRFVIVLRLKDNLGEMVLINIETLKCKDGLIHINDLVMVR